MFGSFYVLVFTSGLKTILKLPKGASKYPLSPLMSDSHSAFKISISVRITESTA